MEENYSDQNERKTGKGLTIVLLIIVLVLAAVSGVLISKLSDTKKESQEVQTILEGQKNSLVEQLTDLQDQFGSLQTDNDTLKILAAEQQERIDKLLQINASNAQKIVTYQKELGTLREVLKSYIAQVDSLNTMNIALTQENREVRSQLREATNMNQSLQQDKDQLTSQMEIASVISVADISAVGLNNRGKENDRVRSVSQIRACCTVRSNAIVSAGERTIYLRILSPSGSILANPDRATLNYQGENIACSAFRVINYNNQDIAVCIYWDNDGSLTAGTYKAEIYLDGNMAGSTSFLLK